MICSKKLKVVLFLLAFIATLQIGVVFRQERLIRTVDAFEPITIIESEATEEPEALEEPMEVSIEEPIEEPVEETSEELPEETEAAEEIVIMEAVENLDTQPRIDCHLDDETQQMIVEKCEEYDVDFSFVMAVIFKESSFVPNVISKSNDYGLMQINKCNHEWLSAQLGITDFLDPEQNVTAGLHMLSSLFEKYDDPAKVLMAYNMGESGARKLWNRGIYSTDYADDILQQADIYNAEIAERMGENVLY